VVKKKRSKNLRTKTLMGRYNDFIMVQVNKPELNKLFTERVSKYNKERREMVATRGSNL
jgi:hypothetical protein